LHEKLQNNSIVLLNKNLSKQTAVSGLYSQFCFALRQLTAIRRIQRWSSLPHWFDSGFCFATKYTQILFDGMLLQLKSARGFNLFFVMSKSNDSRMENDSKASIFKRLTL
jgi:hypothetical protein